MTFGQTLPGSIDLGDVSLSLDWSQIGRRILEVAFILLLAWAAYRGILYLSRRLEKVVAEERDGLLAGREKRGETVAQIIRSAAAAALMIVILLTILSLFVPIGPLLAGVGVLGLAFSFGAQALVKDLIAGFFILAENQYGVGDVIKINESTGGLVERMTLRVVELRDIDGTVHIIPNGEIRQVGNLTKQWSRALLHVGVAYGEDVDRAIETLESLGEEFWEDPEWRPLLLEQPEVPGVERLDDSAVVLRLIGKTMPLKQWDVMRELRRRIKNRFDAEGIEIPFPHRTLYWGSGQESPARPPGPADESAESGAEGAESETTSVAPDERGSFSR